MNRVLPALCLAAFSPSFAVAAEWETGVSGYLNIGVAGGDIDGGSDGLGVFRDGEIHVNGRLTADNGLTFRARVEVEAFTSSDQIDENWGSVSGPFGTILIGSADTALNEHGGVGVVKPNGSFFNYYDNDGGFLPGDPGGFIGENDSLSIRYYYSIMGFEAGVSYQPSVGVDGGNDTNNPVFEGANDQFAFGASYTGDFGDFGFAIGGGYLTNDVIDAYHVGAEASFSGFTLAGFYNNTDASGADTDVYGVGAVYKTGPWSVGGGYALTDVEGGGDSDFVHVGARYRLVPGVDLNGAVEYGEDGTGAEGVAGLLWLGLNF